MKAWLKGLGWVGYPFWRYMDDMMRPPGRWRWLRYVTEQIHANCMWTLCAVRGHEMKDHSSIGPKSGTEAHTCRRCGLSWHHTYY